jgi:hypothetical protein
MNNDEVIELLKKAIDELEKRIVELNSIKKDKSIPFHELPIIQNQVLQRTSSLNLKILFLEQQLHNREVLKKLETDVPALSGAEKSRLEKALETISKDISTTKTVKAAIALAKDISDAAEKAGDSAKVKS